MTTPMTTTLTTDPRQAVQVPGLGHLKEAVDPLLAGLPDWLHALVWAVLVIALLYGALILLARRLLPWAANAFVPPVRAIVEFTGVLLLLPAFPVARLLRRWAGRVPAVMFVYDDLVHGATRGAHWTAAHVLRLAGRAGRASKPVLALVLGAMVITWNVTYCTGAGAGCKVPTSQWADSVSRSIEAAKEKPEPAPTRCPKGKRKKGGKCVSKPR